MNIILIKQWTDSDSLQPALTHSETRDAIKPDYNVYSVLPSVWRQHYE